MRPALASRLTSTLAAALAALPSPALALEASYHSYDGFEETVDAFRLVSMIFAELAAHPLRVGLSMEAEIDVSGKE
ncbi:MULTISPECIES: hypothetical protein [Sphingobium]|nr:MULTISPECIES: hypothetical protein [Sphingobium]RYL98170.1 hypothetical protein EWH10_12105 [Sphingobium fuliginis]WDA34885.1 hypothetical protein PO876_15550 [Sphingobium sp. YC-XJ3]